MNKDFTTKYLPELSDQKSSQAFCVFYLNLLGLSLKENRILPVFRVYCIKNKIRLELRWHTAYTFWHPKDKTAYVTVSVSVRAPKLSTVSASSSLTVSAGSVQGLFTALSLKMTLWVNQSSEVVFGQMNKELNLTVKLQIQLIILCSFRHRSVFVLICEWSLNRSDVRLHVWASLSHCVIRKHVETIRLHKLQVQGDRLPTTPYQTRPGDHESASCCLWPRFSGWGERSVTLSWTTN